VGLLYDDQALDAAWDLVKHWTVEDHHRIREQVPTLALDTKGPRGRSFRDLAKLVLEIAHKGLAARQRINGSGDDETGFLTPLHEIVASGKVPAQDLLDRYNGPWGGDISHVYEMAY
jgi:glutamate--cysteine ligase